MQTIIAVIKQTKYQNNVEVFSSSISTFTNRNCIVILDALMPKARVKNIVFTFIVKLIRSCLLLVRKFFLTKAFLNVVTMFNKQSFRLTNREIEYFDQTQALNNQLSKRKTAVSPSKAYISPAGLLAIANAHDRACFPVQTRELKKKAFFKAKNAHQPCVPMISM